MPGLIRRTVDHRYGLRDRRPGGGPRAGDPEVIFRVDLFGPLNLQPRPGRHWAAIGGKGKELGRAAYTPKAGVRHLFAAYKEIEPK
jgi:hypothetical protein